MSGHDHAHPHRPDLEDAPLSWHMALTEAVIGLLQAKGVVGGDELRRALETIDARSPADGARVVARAWTDPSYRQRLLADVNAAAAELGIDAGGIPIRAVENRPGVHNVIVCTLCSCYPRLLLGPSPDWYKSRAYRSRVVREPRAVLAEFGLELPAETAVVSSLSPTFSSLSAAPRPAQAGTRRPGPDTASLAAASDGGARPAVAVAALGAGGVSDSVASQASRSLPLPAMSSCSSSALAVPVFAAVPAGSVSAASAASAPAGAAAALPASRRSSASASRPSPGCACPRAAPGRAVGRVVGRSAAGSVAGPVVLPSACAAASSACAKACASLPSVALPPSVGAGPASPARAGVAGVGAVRVSIGAALSSAS